MKKIGLLCCCSIFACHPEPKEKSDAEARNAHVAVSQGMIIAPQASISIDVSVLGGTVKELEKKILLYTMPQDEEVGPELWAKGEAFSLKSLEKGSVYSLTPKKKLKEGQNYGIYFRANDDEKGWLAQILYVKLSKPQLVKHDLGEGPKPAVPKNRRIFTFSFDQDIHVLNDEAISLQNKEQKLLIEGIRIPHNEQLIEVTLAPGQLQIGEGYSFSFGAILNKDKTPGDVKPLSFMVGDAQEALAEQSSLSIAMSHDSAEISWHLNQDHFAELFFGINTELQDCLGQACPATVRALSKVSAKDVPLFLSRFYPTKLSAGTTYNLVVRTMDLQGQILLGAASFKTLAAPSLRFSEILINPKLPLGGRENNGEFIELFNASEKKTTFLDLSLIFESTDGASRRVCVLASPDKPLAISSQSYLLVVGQEFDASQWSLPQTSSLLRLPKKSLCGGLPNDRAFIIKLMGEDGALLDRFGAFLWQGKEGSSVARREVLMADEPQNYCFSALIDGPSPGLKNEKFGTCGIGPR